MDTTKNTPIDRTEHRPYGLVSLKPLVRIVDEEILRGSHELRPILVFQNHDVSLGEAQLVFDIMASSERLVIGEGGTYTVTESYRTFLKNQTNTH